MVTIISFFRHLHITIGNTLLSNQSNKIILCITFLVSLISDYCIVLTILKCLWIRSDLVQLLARIYSVIIFDGWVATKNGLVLNFISRINTILKKKDMRTKCQNSDNNTYTCLILCKLKRGFTTPNPTRELEWTVGLLTS